jgi:putative ABC transport system permease protein
MSISPGKIETTGMPGALAGTTDKLTIGDAKALERVSGVEAVVPVSMGTTLVEHGKLSRSVFTYGVTAEVPAVWKFTVRQGRFLPEGDPRRRAPLTVIGPTLKRELFGTKNALGKHVRIAGQRFLVIGVMAPKGRFLGIDLDDAAYVPVASAQEIFGRDDLIRIDVLFRPGVDVHGLEEDLAGVMARRHGGEEDFTITTQTEMLSILDNILGVVSLLVGGIAGISLLVGAIGILTVMWISVNERTSEIGLAKALGASPRQILVSFLLEAALLATAGGAAGAALGLGLARALTWVFPGLPVKTAPEYVLAAILVSGAVGVLSGVMPARRAAGLDPVIALRDL